MGILACTMPGEMRPCEPYCKATAGGLEYQQWVTQTPTNNRIARGGDVTRATELRAGLPVWSRDQRGTIVIRSVAYNRISLVPSVADGIRAGLYLRVTMRGSAPNNRILGVHRGPLDFRTSESRRAFLRCGLSQWRRRNVDPTAIRVQMALSRITVRELARRTGVSECTVWRWREHRPHVAPETAEKLTRALFQPAGTGTVARIEEPRSAA